MSLCEKCRNERRRTGSISKTGPARSTRPERQKDGSLEQLKGEIRKLRASLDEEADRKRGYRGKKILKAADRLEEAKAILEDL